MGNTQGSFYVRKKANEVSLFDNVTCKSLHKLSVFTLCQGSHVQCVPEQRNGGDKVILEEHCLYTKTLFGDGGMNI